MKYKIVIGINEKNALEIQEYSELEDDQFFLVYKNIYNSTAIEAAIEGGDRLLLDTLRNDKFFPSREYMNQIMDVVKKIYDLHDENPFELSFDDQDFNIEETVEDKEDAENKTSDDISKKSDDIGELLGDNTTSDNKA